MNRELLFRARAVHDNELVYGNFIHSKRFAGCGNEYRIHNQDTGLESDVDPDTVQQLTPFLDCYEKPIYEGDLVRDYITQDIFEVVFTDQGNFGLMCDKHLDYEYKLIDPEYSRAGLLLITTPETRA